MMTAEMGQQNWFTFAGVVIKHLIVTVSDDSSQGFVKRSLMLGISKTVYENEIRITLNGYRNTPPLPQG